MGPTLILLFIHTLSPLHAWPTLLNSLLFLET